MLQRIKDLPQHVAGIHAVGKVTVNDYETILKPILDEKVSSIGDINYLVIFETDGSHFTPVALWRDLTLMMKYYRRWNKIAVVTDRRGVEWFSDVFKFVVPCESKGFTLERLDEAIKWISETDEDR